MASSSGTVEEVEVAADRDAKKRRAALAAVQLLAGAGTIGIGSGSTVNCFIDALAAWPGLIDSAVSASEDSSRRLRAAGIALADLNDFEDLPLYIDGADEANPSRQLIRAAEGADARESRGGGCTPIRLHRRRQQARRHSRPISVAGGGHPHGARLSPASSLDVALNQCGVQGF